MSVSVKSKIKIQVSALICDKISLTLDIPEKYRPYILAQMKEAGAFNMRRSQYRLNLRTPLNNKYLTNPEDDKSQDTNLLIQVDPKRSNYYFARLEYTPAKIEMFSVPAVVEDFIPLDFSTLMEEASITRIDLTIDILGADMDNVLVLSKYKRVNATRNNGGKTLYLGKQDSKTSFRIYDKSYLIEKKNSQKSAELEEPKPTKPITRIELELKPKGITFSDIQEMNNPFADIRVFHIPEALINGDSLFIQTLTVARLDNLKKALGPLSQKEKTGFLKRLEFCEAKWWNPDAVWEQVPQLIETLIDPLSAALEETGT